MPYATAAALSRTEQAQALVNIEVCSEPVSGITSFHDVELQRLDVFMDYGGTKVRHTKEHFTNTAVWERIPCIFQKTSGDKPVAHPEFSAVTTQTLDPDKYVNVGYVENPHISPEGEPVLSGKIAFTNSNCSLLAKAGELSLSTGFSAQIRTLDDGWKEIAGQVQPNHILIFKRGSCPNCYPNDNVARFRNISQKGDDEMDDESKGVLKKILDHFENLTKKPDKIMEHKNQEGEENIESLKAEIARLKAKIAELEGGAKPAEEQTNLVNQYKAANHEAKVAFENILKENKDLKWTLLKNVLPAAWTDTPEHETATREKYEKTPAIFVADLATFQNQKPANKPAQGDVHTNMDVSTEDGYGTITFKKEAK